LVLQFPLFHVPGISPHHESLTYKCTAAESPLLNTDNFSWPNVLARDCTVSLLILIQNPCERCPWNPWKSLLSYGCSLFSIIFSWTHSYRFSSSHSTRIILVSVTNKLILPKPVFSLYPP
jgi:hypothetical protein